MKRFAIILAVAAFAISSLKSEAQTVSLSTNLLDYACLGTLNADVSYSLSRRWSVTAGARYNPFTFRKGDPDKQFQLRQQSYSLGARLWPWHTWSGWWFAGKLRYQEYNSGGIRSLETREGDRFGAGLYAGYTYMLTSHLNIEFGLGLWSGLDVYRCYSCPVCGVTLESGKTHFILPDDIMISLAYVF
ncbi:MAG: DUF3575 domain-containing protein [Bacteroidales bacterium]|nr:DUF3575 domain-containing protein [Bacteroidales bacterium]